MFISDGERRRRNRHVRVIPHRFLRLHPKRDHLHFTCLTIIGNVLILVLGPGPICLILEPLSSKVTHLFHCEQEKGTQKERTYWDDAGKEVKAALKCSVNEGAETECGELALGEVTYKE